MQMRVLHPIWEIYGNLVLLLLFGMTFADFKSFASFCYVLLSDPGGGKLGKLLHMNERDIV